MIKYVTNDNGIDREMTDAEIATYQKLAKIAVAEQADFAAVLEANAAAKISAHAKLKALGLTDQEIAALVG